MKRGDRWLIFLLILIIGAVLSINAYRLSQAKAYSGTKYARIELNGDFYKQVELTESKQEIEISTERGYDLLQISDRGIQVIRSDCPEKICMAYGFIDRIGEMIVCLPNRMTVEVIGETQQQPEYDILVN